MSSKKIKRIQLSMCLQGASAITVQGSLEYDLWLKMERLKQNLTPISEKQNELIKAIKTKCGFDTIDEKMKQAERDEKPFVPSKSEEAVIKKTDEKLKAFFDEEIEIPFDGISEEQVKDFDSEILKYRSAIMPLINFSDAK